MLFRSNIPFAVGGGVAGVCGDDAATAPLTAWLETSGTVVAVDELMFDAVTAISGSGPGMLAYVVEALAEAARAVGFDDADAERLHGEGPHRRGDVLVAGFVACPCLEAVRAWRERAQLDCRPRLER